MVFFYNRIWVAALVGLCCLSSDVFAAAAVQRRVQMQKEAQAQMAAQYQQQMYQQQVAQYQQQMAAQQQAAYVQAYQQAAQQKALAEYAAYKQQLQVAVAQRQAQIQAYQQAQAMVAQKQAAQAAQVKQAVAYKQAADMIQYRQARQVRDAVEAKAQAEVNEQVRQYADYLAKRKAALAGQAVAVAQAKTAREIAEYNHYQQAKVVQNRKALAVREEAEQVKRMYHDRMAMEAMAQRQGRPAGEEDAFIEETTVGIKDLWTALDNSSQSWSQIIDDEIKALTVGEYIDRFAQRGVLIKKSPGHYAKFLDMLVPQMPGILDAPFMNVLSYIAIMEYDFENGQNKDELARQVLGEEIFRSNKARLR
jgi:hypothetical protein